MESQQKFKRNQIGRTSETGYHQKSRNVIEAQHSKVLLNKSATGAGSNSNIRSKVINETKGTQKSVIVRDSNGEDVTPVNFTSLKYSTRDGTSSGADLNVRETVSDLLNHLDMLGGASFSEGSLQKSSAFGGDSQQQLSQQESLGDDGSSDHGSDTDDGRDSITNMVKRKISMNVLPGLSMAPRIKENDPLKTIAIRLSETETMFFLTLPSITVSSESIEETTMVKAQNAKYKELKSIIQNNDNYISRSTQTLSSPTKSKEVQAHAQKVAHAQVMVNQWEIYDDYNKEEDKLAQGDLEKVKDVVELESRLIRLESTDMRSITQTNSVVGSQITMDQSIDTSTDSRTSINIQSKSAITNPALKDEQVSIIMNSNSLADKLSLVEKAIVGNSFSKKLIQYRNVPDDGAIEQKRVDQLTHTNEENEVELQQQQLTREDFTINTLPTLQNLWTYKCELTKGRQVTYMSINKQNEDILAVAYGESRLGTTSSPGLILCWSAKNPEWPDRIYHCDSPVTSVDFSKSNPSLLAAGFIDGRIAIYDVKQNSNQRVMNDCDNGKHRDPVWELKWVEKEGVLGDEQSRGEILVSVSTDGRVTQWQIRKGLEFQDLMILKRMTKQKKGANNTTITTNSFIARQTGGLCFDFNQKDTNIYLVGTEDGQIHKCSSSYNEQYLNTYSNHTGTVNKVKWSPFSPNVFLSCSSDWTVRLWSQEDEEEIFKFQSGKDTINDIAWSPQNSCYFATVSSNGRLEIWDLQFSVLDPAINHAVLDRNLTSVQFGTISPTVMTGDDYGAVTVYKLCRHIGPDEDPTSNGFVSIVRGKSTSDENVKKWKKEQIIALNQVISSKATAIVAN